MTEKDYVNTKDHILRLRKMATDPKSIRNKKFEPNPELLLKQATLKGIGHPVYKDGDLYT